MKKLFLIVLAIGLGGCESEAEHKAKFMASCLKGFNDAQCETLYSVKKSSEDAEASAAISSFNSGIAMGMAAGAAGRR